MLTQKENSRYGRMIGYPDNHPTRRFRVWSYYVGQLPLRLSLRYSFRPPSWDVTVFIAAFVLAAALLVAVIIRILQP